MRLVIFGAGGGIGSILTQRALAEGHEVTAVVRNDNPFTVAHPSLHVVQADVTDAAAVERAVRGHEVVFCALGPGSRRPTTLVSVAAHNVTMAMDVHGVRRLVFLSNFGVLDESAPDLLWAALLPFVKVWLRHLLRDHRRALDEIRQHSWEWVAVRPMILTNGPWTGRYRIAIEGLPKGGRCISRADVADFMLRQVGTDEYVHTVPAIAY